MGFESHSDAITVALAGTRDWQCLLDAVTLTMPQLLLKQLPSSSTAKSCGSGLTQWQHLMCCLLKPVYERCEDETENNCIEFF